MGLEYMIYHAISTTMPIHVKFDNFYAAFYRVLSNFKDRILCTKKELYPSLKMAIYFYDMQSDSSRNTTMILDTIEIDDNFVAKSFTEGEFKLYEDDQVDKFLNIHPSQAVTHPCDI